jgi:hypothetical protein
MQPGAEGASGVAMTDGWERLGQKRCRCGGTSALLSRFIRRTNRDAG